MTVGSGIGPDLLTPGRGPGRSRARACAPTAGGELHPALKTFVYRRTGAASVPARAERGGMPGVGSLSAGKGSGPGPLEIATGQSRFPTENGSDPDPGPLALWWPGSDPFPQERAL